MMGVSGRTAAIVVAYRGGARLLDCIDRLLTLSPAELDILVVVNGPADRAVVELEMHAGREPRLAVRRLGSNRGFAGGVNDALRVCGGRGYWAYALVNQDCMVEAGWLEPMLELLAGETDVGLVGAHILDPDGTTTQHAGGRVLANGLTQHVGRGSRLRPADRREVEYVTAALCAFRAEVWERFGPFDEGFNPVYFEEVDLCMRLRAGGLRIVCLADSRARHFEASSSEGAGSGLFLSHYHRSRMRFVARHLLRPGHLASTLRAELAWVATLRRACELRPLVRAYLGLPRQLLSVRRGWRRAVR